MAHDHLKESIEAQTWRSSLLLIMTFMGGLLVLISFISDYIFDQPQVPAGFAFLGALVLGLPLVWHAVKHLLEGHMHMDELVALAVLAAMVTEQYLEAGVIAFFMIISTLIETRTALGARAAITSLIKLTPTRARRLLADGHEEEVEASRLTTDDIIRVRPGDNIAADGVIINGESSVNQASITGESLPADKAVGDEVFGGTSNLTGALDIRVSKAGTETTLGRVQKLILDAERTRIPLMRLIDQYAAWYTPTIIMLAAIVLFATKSSGDSISRVICGLWSPRICSARTSSVSPESGLSS